MMKIKIANLVQLADHDGGRDAAGGWDEISSADCSKMEILLYSIQQQKRAERITCDDAATNMTYDVLSSKFGCSSH